MAGKDLALCYRFVLFPLLYGQASGYTRVQYMPLSLLATSDVLGTGWFGADAAGVQPGNTVAIVVTARPASAR
jgi:hypothetical protein